MAAKGRVVLAYSGGLDTSVICRWLAEQGYEVIAWSADVGQREDWKAVAKKARRSGAKKFLKSDLRAEFVEEFVWPAIQMNARYEGCYFLGTSLARPCIAREQVRVALKEKAAAIAHGATGKGNDQVRFELTAAALAPGLKVVAPWRMPEFYTRIKGRQDAIRYARKHNIPIKATAKKPWSSDENAMHISVEAGMLEDPARAPLEDMFELSVSPRKAPDRPALLTLGFEQGRAVSLDGRRMKPLPLLQKLNALGGRHGVGRVDMVESRFVGMKSRGVYETPGGAILMAAHRDLEGLTLDRDLALLKDTLMPRFCALVYNGFWFSQEMEALMTFLESSQRFVTGKVRLELYKGNVTILGRESPASLYNPLVASMDDDAGAYNPQDATGFIRLASLPLRAHARRLAAKTRKTSAEARKKK
ncbi:MAG: argininosuccinate synthase [Planctomycetota bacterium]